VTHCSTSSNASTLKPTDSRCADTVADDSCYGVDEFDQEFGSVAVALIAADIAAHPDTLDVPDWAARRYGAPGLGELLVRAGEGVTLPEWTLEYDEPVLRSCTNSRKRFHAPAVDADGPTPRCSALRGRGDDLIEGERENLRGFYTQCENEGCQEWFENARAEPPEGGLPLFAGNLSAMNNGGRE